jgi:serine/threonine-protein phosphatase 2A regulatory subunit B'
MIEESWPHIQVAYELLLRIIIQKSFDSKSVQKYITHQQLNQLFELFKSPDPRERDYLKTIVHRIYGKCLVLRSIVRVNLIKNLMN